MISLAREQSREGGNVLDINVDYAGRDNAADMAEVVKRLVRQVNAPLMIDSTQLATIEAGLKHAPGKCLINSANFEDGDEKFDAICRLAKTYGAGLVIGSIDEDPESAMARTAERKFAISKRGLERAVEGRYLGPADVVAKRADRLELASLSRLRVFGDRDRELLRAVDQQHPIDVREQQPARGADDIDTLIEVARRSRTPERCATDPVDDGGKP